MSAPAASGATPWWRDAVFYQIWPRSFADGDGDGIGDLHGVRRRLDHLAWLGVDAIWLSPFYPSPQADFGYDVADHCDVDPAYGDLEAFDALVADAHARGIRVVIDLVPNHTSDTHPWFVASRSSRDDPHRDRYVWRDPAPDGGPPNDWMAAFGGPAWTFDERTGQYYLHSFLPSQPDLDWGNPAVGEAFDAIMRFWLDRGADGFRVDVVYRLAKDRTYPDNPVVAGVEPGGRHPALKNMHEPWGLEVCSRFRSLVDGYGDRVVVGEVTLLDADAVAFYYGDGTDGLHLAFDFHFVYDPWDAGGYGDEIEALERALPPGAWPCWTLSNHDAPRHVVRYGTHRARAATVFLLTLRGTPFLYQGEEIGMTGCAPARSLDVAGRDAARTPVQWDASPNAGFCPPDAAPWMDVCDDHDTVNVAAQRDDPSSLLRLYRRLIALRREMPALRRGSWHRLDAPDGVLCFERRHEGSVARVAVNFTSEPVAFETAGWTVAIATHHGEPLPADGAVVLVPS